MIIPTQPASSRDVARHYDELDRFYRELWGEHLHHGLFLDRGDDPEVAAERLVELVGDLGGVTRESEVLDVGCGYGATARQLARGRGAQVTGITLSTVQHSRAVSASQHDPGVRFLCRDWMENGLPDGCCDVVVAIESLAHMPDKARFFHEVRRTLRPGGRVVVCAWAAGTAVGGLRRRFLLEPICREGELPGLGTLPEYRALAEAAGLRIMETHELSRAVRRTWSVCALRLVTALLARPEYRRLLVNRRLRSRIFALTVFRIWLAYRVGAMRYGVLVGRKPSSPDGAGPD